MNYELLVMSGKKGIIVESSFTYAIKIVSVYKAVVQEYKEYVLSKQLLRAVTGVGALVREAQNAESKADFIHKLGMAQKECDESLYWLELMHETKYLSSMDYEEIHREGAQLLKIFRAAILTTKQRHIPRRKGATSDKPTYT